MDITEVIFKEIIRICKRTGFRKNPYNAKVAKEHGILPAKYHTVNRTKYRSNEQTIWFKAADSGTFSRYLRIYSDRVIICIHPRYAQRDNAFIDVNSYTPPSKYTCLADITLADPELFMKIQKLLRSIYDELKKE